MNRPELFQKSVDTLLDAYNKKDIRHANCSACAVGNLLLDVAVEKDIPNNSWAHIFMYRTDKNEQVLHNKEDVSETDYELGMTLINSSGYTVEELMKIEYAFETAGDKKDEQYKGLCAVLEVLKEIHEKDNIIVEREKLDTIYEMGRVCTPAMVS